MVLNSKFAKIGVGRMWSAVEEVGESGRSLRRLWMIQEIRMIFLSFVYHRSVRRNKDMEGN